jgi:hypothetical protein
VKSCSSFAAATTIGRCPAIFGFTASRTDGKRSSSTPAVYSTDVADSRPKALAVEWAIKERRAMEG